MGSLPIAASEGTREGDENKMKPLQVEAYWEKDWPVNWEFVGIIFFPDEKSAEFILVDGIKYKKEG